MHLLMRHSIRKAILEVTHADEHAVVTDLLQQYSLSDSARERIIQRARQLVATCRQDKKSKSGLDAFLQEFGLSNKEGVALMCLAESLLRIPDRETADRLIAEKIQSGDWHSHLGHSDSLFVNASVWGLMLTGKLFDLDPDITQETPSWMKRLTTRLSEPVVRTALNQAMKIMSDQFVLGRTIEEGITRGEQENESDMCFSFDMLGESARSETQAKKYFDAYSHAINVIGETNKNTDIYHANGISVKLSALHPRYHYSHMNAVMSELLPRIKSLCLQAKSYNIGLSIDAEEASRLEISLDIFESLARDTALQGWQGLGFVLQAYQKRAPLVAEWLIELAKKTDRRLMVRLVKGAYWDAEIKHAQEKGFKDYPVFTRKPNTDLCYQHCALTLLNASQQIYPQFATHNAYTAAMIIEIAGDKPFEFQRLHGMGHILYRQLQQQFSDCTTPIRVYAPIGVHQDLLPYLVRRLLENGANSSFVNRFLDDETAIDDLIQDTISQVQKSFPYRHPSIPIPADIFCTVGEDRKNSQGINLDCSYSCDRLLKQMKQASKKNEQVFPVINGEAVYGEGAIAIRNPANTQQILGHYSEPSEEMIEKALEFATQVYSEWNAVGAMHRSEILRCAADLLEADMPQLMSVIIAEAGRTIADALSEVREAADFCRYYALHAEQILTNKTQLQGRGVFLCISPWNFPLAIFVGQIAAALVAGNSVIAKPAEQTSLIALRAIELFHQAGVPEAVLHLLPGNGASIGGQLISDDRVAGVTFTGSTETAQLINQQLLKRDGKLIPFIAETGGQNCMIVDSSALLEQVVDDVIASAFLSAGQRCSSLRVLFLQEDIADSLLTLLKGAMASLVIGDPSKLSTDIGPVIDQQALKVLNDHIKTMKREGRLIASLDISSDRLNENVKGWFCAPHLFEIDSLSQLQREVFGPILHVIRYQSDALSDVIQQINATGYGLTLGVHSRVETFAEYVFQHTHVGNTYVNRNMIGAVVGVNPFGGKGLSGTGPKAGGPYYLYRFTCPEQSTISVSTEEGEQEKFSIDVPLNARLNRAVLTAIQNMVGVVSEKLRRSQYLSGPTGEFNTLTLIPRGALVLIIKGTFSYRDFIELAAALSVGCSVLVGGMTKKNAFESLVSALTEYDFPVTAMQMLKPNEWLKIIHDGDIAGVICSREHEWFEDIKKQLARRQGAILPLVDSNELSNLNDDAFWTGHLTRFMTEKTYTDNLVARGGNTQLFNLPE